MLYLVYFHVNIDTNVKYVEQVVVLLKVTCSVSNLTTSLQDLATFKIPLVT